MWNTGGRTTAISRTNSSRCCSKTLGLVAREPGFDIVHTMDCSRETEVK